MIDRSNRNMLQSLLCPMFRQKHVCKGCSPVTNSEACLYPHSFIQHQHHVANNRKNASYLPRHRDFSCLSLELGTAVTAPDSSCVLHTAQFEFTSWKHLLWSHSAEYGKYMSSTPSPGVAHPGVVSGWLVASSLTAPITTWHLRMGAGTEKH